MRNTKGAIISQWAPFGDLTPADRRALKRVVQPMAYPAGATIQRAGAVDRRLYLVVEGTVELIEDGRPAVVLGAGGVFGDAGRRASPHRATAVARTSVRTLQIPSLALTGLAARYPSVASWLAVAGATVPQTMAG